MKSKKWQLLYRKILKAKVRIHFFVMDKGVFGEQCGVDVYLSLMKNNPVARNYIHEVLHYLYVDMSEKQVRYWEGVIWRNLTAKKRLVIYRRIFR